MTELLNRPEPANEEDHSRIDTPFLQAMFDAEPAPEEASAETTAEHVVARAELSPTGSLLLRAAQRVNTVLERRALTKAHGQALSEYRERDNSGYVDHLASLKDSQEATPMARATADMALDREHHKADREALIDKAKSKVRGFGSSTLTRLRNTGDTVGDSVMNGFGKVEAGMDSVGKIMFETKKTLQGNSQTRQFNRETKANSKQFQKEYAKEMKDFDKQAKSESRLQAKVDKWESKFAAQEDRRFERSMRKKSALERREARRERRAERVAMIKEAIVSVPERAGDAMMSGFGKLENGLDKAGQTMMNTKEAVSDRVERSKASVHTTRAAGRAALEAFTDTRRAHNEQNQL